VQIGIADFSNSPAYALRAQELGIRVIARSELRRRSVEDIWAEAISIAGASSGSVHVDFDVDVCDRSVVPGCPAAAPGGISADELRQFAYLAGWSNLVKSIDITEVDATADAPDGRTVRLAALLLLEAAAGLASR
jgi:formiminoglutamase